MATFLFLVSVTATTLLLLAIAADEAMNGLRPILRRWAEAHEAADIENLEYHQHLIRSGAEPARVAKAQHACAPARPEPVVAHNGGWVPDRAA